MDAEMYASPNSEFWDELCGTGAAAALGITEVNKESLALFDRWYLDFYPYLTEYLKSLTGETHSFLEIGLGFGTVSQWLMESGAIVTGLDIAEGPVSMFDGRARMFGYEATGREGDILSPPDGLGLFDAVIAIGSLHHTGDMVTAITNAVSLLKPEGKLLLMVYNAYSYRRILKNPLQTLLYSLKEALGHRGVVPSTSSARQRARYDVNSAGDAAPHTDWISVKSLRALLEPHGSCAVNRRNMDSDLFFGRVPREKLLGTFLETRLGLDLYAVLQKSTVAD